MSVTIGISGLRLRDPDGSLRADIKAAIDQGLNVILIREKDMADRTSAEIFGDIIEILGEDEKLDQKTLLRRIYEMSQNYDFTEEQLSEEAQFILGYHGLWSSGEEQ